MIYTAIKSYATNRIFHVAAQSLSVPEPLAIARKLTPELHGFRGYRTLVV